MRERFPTLILGLIASNLILGQSISNITISKEGDEVAYIKNGDSLFIGNLTHKNPDIFVDNELKGNGNQRFLNWVDSNTLIYEKNGNLQIFHLKQLASKALPKEKLDSLRLFQWYLIRQTTITAAGDLYFSAGTKNTNLPFQLYKLNVFNGDLKRLFNSELDVANVAVSPDRKYVVFNSYKYIDNNPESNITIFNSRDASVLFSSATYKNTFFSGFKWSPNGNLMLARKSDGQALLFRFKFAQFSLEEISISLDPSESLVDFYSDSTLIMVKHGEGGKIIGSLNLYSGKKQILIGENPNYLDILSKDGKRDILFVSENGIQPKSIWKTAISDDRPPRTEKVKSFASRNPLAKYRYVIYQYKNNGEGYSSSYVYLPASLKKSKRGYSLLILPYGGYSDTYPDLSYFLYGKLFAYLDRGFIIAFPNTRGIDSERQTKDYGKVQLEDTEKFIKGISHKYPIDPKRIFVIGHSHGATMVYYYLTHSDVFAGGIAINGASDWVKQAERRSMSGLPTGMGGMPDEHKEKYLQASPMENLHRLYKPLLMFAGKKDTQIPFDINAQAFNKKAAGLKKRTKLVVFDDEGHLIENDANRRSMWREVDSFLFKEN